MKLHHIYSHCANMEKDKTWKLMPEKQMDIFRFAAVSVFLEVRKHKPALVHAVLLSVGKMNLPGVAERIIIIAGWMSPLIARGQPSRGTLFCNKILITLGFWSGIKVADASQELMSHAMETRALKSNHLESVINDAVNTLLWYRPH